MLRTTDEAYNKMIGERDKLQERITELSLFIREVRRNEREDVTVEELHDMEDQVFHMNKYLQILCIRIYRAERSTHH